MGELWVQGGRRLKGNVKVSGAKNGVLPVLAACILADGSLQLTNVPNISDVGTMIKILEHLGIRVAEGMEDGCIALNIECGRLTSSDVSYELAREIRGSIFLLGPLLGRLGKVKIPFPGGDDLGARPIDLHIEAMKTLGADVRVEHGYVVATCKKLTGARYLIDPFRSRGTSVGVTHNLMMAGCYAEGITIIENAAREPEVVDLAVFLNSMGARIRGAGTDIIKIDGCSKLTGCDHSVLPDRIEAGTYLLAGAITGGDITVEGISPQYLRMLCWALEQAGCKIFEEDNSLRIVGPERLKATNIMTWPYPGFATDLQAPYTAAMSIADGTSIIAENIYDSRFTYVDELTRMGADIKVVGNRVIVTGVNKLSAAPVEGTDIRAVVALVVAGLVAEGKTIIRGLYHLDRGYDNMEAKLSSLGAAIDRI